MNEKLTSTRGKHRRLPIVLVHYVGALLRPIHEAARENDWRLVNMKTVWETIPKDYSPVGIIIGLPLDHPHMSWVKQFDCPVVRVGYLPNPMDHEVPAVITDLATAGSMAAEHFFERDFKHMAYLGEEMSLSATPTFESFRRRAETLGCSCDLYTMDRKEGETLQVCYQRRTQEIKTWLAELPKPVGLMTSGDMSAVWSEMFCDSLGLAVPEDVAILTLDNDELSCETAPIELSSIDMGRSAQGREAVNVLKRIIEGEPVLKDTVVIPPVGVIERHSTNVLAVPNPVVARAIRFIWDNLERQISVDDIAMHVGVSRRTLERLFRKVLGRSINGERLRKRLEHCTELLRGTQMTVAEIADACGFPSRSYMHRAFKKRYHISPAEYRKRVVEG